MLTGEPFAWIRLLPTGKANAHDKRKCRGAMGSGSAAAFTERTAGGGDSIGHGRETRSGRVSRGVATRRQR